MFKNTLFMTLSSIFRLLANAVLFIFLARFLGPEEFGRLMYGFTVATIAVLVIEFGFSQQLLRDIGKEPDQVLLIMGRVFLAKILLTLLVVGSGLLVFVMFPKLVEDQIIFWLFFVSCTLASFADYFNVAFRGIGRFHEETRVALVSSLFHVGFLCSLAFLESDLTTLAQGFVGSRALNLALSWIAYRRIVGGLKFGGQPLKTAIGTLKRGFPYAADTGFTNFFSQVDILIVNHYLGAASVGLYQAGMRFLQGASQFTSVLCNVYLPAIAGCGNNQEQLQRMSRKFNSQMILMGAVGWAIFSFGGEWITRLSYGEKYAELIPLWPYIGLLLFLRYVAGSQGVLLTANGSQRIRVWAQIAGLAVLLSVAPSLIKEYGLSGMLVTLQLTLVTLFLIYGLALSFKKLPSGFSASRLLASTGVFVVAVILLLPPDIQNMASVVLSKAQQFTLSHLPLSNNSVKD